MREIAQAAICLYRRYISPYKGFACAYRVHTGRQSCSHLGERAISRYGLFKGLVVLNRRTYLCGVAHRRHAQPARRIGPFSSQRGECDCPVGGCDSCDLPSGKSFSGLGQFLSCCDCCNCDWPSRKRKPDTEEKYVYIPPNARRSAPVQTIDSVA